MLCRPLIGRKAELETLHVGLRRARAGSGSAIVIVGGPGLGKTRLLRELRTVAAATAEGRCSPGGGTLRPFHEALMAVVNRGSLGSVKAPLLRRWMTGSSFEAPLDSSSVLVLADELLRVFSAMAADDPLVITIDDLERAHPETLAVFEYLADHVAEHSLLLVGALRDELGGVVDMADRLKARRSAELIHLQPLSREESLTMSRYCLESEDLAQDLAEAVWERAEGVPFAVEELLETAASSALLTEVEGAWDADPSFAEVLPVTIAASVRSRIQQLPGEGARILAHAAMLGRSFRLEPLVAALPIDATELQHTIRTAIRIHLLEQDRPGEVRFRHALTHDAVLADVSPPERAEIGAALLERTPASGPARLTPEARYLLSLEAGRTNQAVDALVDVVTARLEEGAFDSASLAIESARSIDLKDVDVIARLEHVALDLDIAVGDMEHALLTGRRLLGALHQGHADARAIAGARLRLARAALTAGDLDLVESQLSLVDTDELDDSDLLADHLLLGGELSFAREAYDASERAARKILEQSNGSTPWQTMCEAWSLLGRCSRVRSFDESRLVFEKVLELAELHDSKPWKAKALLELGAVDLHRNGRSRRLEEAREQAVEIGAMATAAEIDLQAVFQLGTQFRLDEAMEAAERCSELAERYRLGLLPLSLIQRAALHAWEGDDARMEMLIEEATALAPGDPMIQSIAWGDCRGFAAMWQDDIARATDMLDRAIAFPVSYETAAAPSRALWALLKTVADDDGDASRAAVRATQAFDAWWMVALLHYADAIAHGRSGDGHRAEESVAAGDATIDRQLHGGWVQHIGRRYAAEFAIEQDWGDPERWLSAAEDFYEDKHPAFAAGCRGLLRRMGASTSRRGRGSSPVPRELKKQKVSSREVDVLALIADGLSNQEIADRLFLSPRTVEKHVSSLLSKTGSRSRTQLSALYVRVFSARAALNLRSLSQMGDNRL